MGKNERNVKQKTTLETEEMQQLQPQQPPPLQSQSQLQNGLPQTQETHSTSNNHVHNTTNTPQKRRTILVVEDNMVNLKVCKNAPFTHTHNVVITHCHTLTTPPTSHSHHPRHTHTTHVTLTPPTTPHHTTTFTLTPPSPHITLTLTPTTTSRSLAYKIRKKDLVFFVFDV